ncbi:MAG: hypothetical protein CVU65_12370 [Deltaproteobacteria bacterium HGW-Deltaproteobacteria-22]|nr:MAG: hypothetical protein CVU65_12370 [Deltaproteobacteria bacterium HGW-Deltaproteobacteria-22]
METRRRIPDLGWLGFLAGRGCAPVRVRTRARPRRLPSPLRAARGGPSPGKADLPSQRGASGAASCTAGVRTDPAAVRVGDAADLRSAPQCLLDGPRRRRGAGLLQEHERARHVRLAAGARAPRDEPSDRPPRRRPVGSGGVRRHHDGLSAIARALDSARELLTDVRDPKVDRAQVIILLSDGEDHLGRPSEAASELNKLGIKVFTVGIGSSEGQLVPSLGETGEVTGYVKHDMQYVTSKLDEATLMNIAQVTGGQYFRATKEDFGTDRVIAAISDYKRSQAEKQVFVEKHEEFIWFLLPGLFLLLVDFLLLGNAGLRRQKKEASA